MEQDLVNPEHRDTKRRLDGISPSFCAAKWNQVTLHLHNGHTQSCHHVKSHEVNVEAIRREPSALHNTPEKMEARDQMLRGERPKECRYCWKMEDAGRVSDRVIKSAEDWARPHLEQLAALGVGPTNNPRYVEISFDSVCNFKCMYCGPAYSTAWAEETRKHGAYPTSRNFNREGSGVSPLPEEERLKRVDAFWQWWPRLAPDLLHFRITGGEPLLAKETFRVLEWLEKNPVPDLNFAINSNMSAGPERLGRLISSINGLQGKVKTFTLYTSIDSVGAKAEYIRYGMKFDRYVDNVERLLRESRWPITVSYMITVNALCLSGLKDLVAMILDQRQRYPQHWIAIDTPFLQNPEHMAVDILPLSFVSYIDEVVSFMRANRSRVVPRGFYESEIVMVDRIRALLAKPTKSALRRWILRRDFFRMFEEYDRRRGTDFLKTFPEYEAFWNQCRRSAWI